MDWNSLKEKAVKLKDSAVSKSKPFLDKAADKSKPYLNKAAEWGYDHVQKIPMVMKNGEDFEKVRIEKNLVIFVLEKDEEFSKRVMMEFPIMLSKAWIASATTRIIQKEESPELLALLDNPACPAVLIYKKGILFRKIEDPVELGSFVKDFNIFDLPEAPVQEWVTDILAEIEKPIPKESEITPIQKKKSVAKKKIEAETTKPKKTLKKANSTSTL